jgi:Ras-related protein Rab-7A
MKKRDYMQAQKSTSHVKPRSFIQSRIPMGASQSQAPPEPEFVCGGVGDDDYSFRRGKKCLVKVIMLGEAEVGKTCLYQRALQPEVVQFDRYRATIGADFLSREWSLSDQDVPEDLRGVTLQMWDTAGQERFQGLGVAFYRGADGLVLVYDVTVRESFETLDRWVEEFFTQLALETDEQRVDFPKVLIGNKADLAAEARAVSQAEGLELAERLGAVFCETSAQTGEFCSEAVANIASLSARRSVVHEFAASTGSMVKSAAKT